MRTRQVVFTLIALALCVFTGCTGQGTVSPAAERPRTETATNKPAASAVPPTQVPTGTPILPAPTAGPTAMPTMVPLPKPALRQFIITFWTPPPITEDSLRQIADGGFNLVMINPVAPSYGRKLMDLAHSLGLMVMLTDPVISPYRLDLAGDIQELTENFKDHPALWGYFLTDEPGANLFPDFARLNRLLLENDPQHFPYINLFPNYASPGALGTADYKSHVRSFVEVVGPAILSYDHYALTPQGDRPGYFANLELIRSEALRADIPFMQIILATPFPGVRDVTSADLRYQVYTTLAYGAKGISYFTYAVPNVSTFGDGLLDRAGNPTPKWNWAREINLEIAQLGRWLLELRSTGVYFTHPPEPECAGIERSSLVASASGGRLQLGEFLDEAGQPWLMVVNLDREQAVNARLVLKGGERNVQVVSKLDGNLQRLECADAQDCRLTDDGYLVALSLAPADGILLRLD